MPNAPQPRPTLLLILDGWGYSQESKHNAIHSARTGHWDKLWSECPHSLLHCSGAEVGLPGGQMGNSEVGHLNMGAGRVIYQEYTRINRSVKSGSFFTNATLTEAVDKAQQGGNALHIFGLLSPGGVHSHEEHICAMAELAQQRGLERIYLHAFLDGRDTPPRSAAESLRVMDEKFAELGKGRIASLIGRYFAMDRDNRWSRVEQAYDLITSGIGKHRAATALDGLKMAYARGESDEFVEATAISPPGESPIEVADGDVIIFMNFRADRAREITRAFLEPDFDGFQRKVSPKLAEYVSLTEYSHEFDIPVAYPPSRPRNSFPEYISSLGLHQLRIAETEKYAHVTFFFSGGREQPYPWEERILIPSPHVDTYDQQPQMSAPEVTARLLEEIRGGRHDVIICNFANPDMVGHTGNFEATVEALEVLDQSIGQLVEAMGEVGGEMLITADHGNAEQMCDYHSGQPHTAHTTNRVPLVYVGQRPLELEQGTLADISPTLLAMMGLEQPTEMTGHSLIRSTRETQ